MPLEIQIQRNIGGNDSGAFTAPELEKHLTPVLGGANKDLVFD